MALQAAHEKMVPNFVYKSAMGHMDSSFKFTICRKWQTRCIFEPGEGPISHGPFNIISSCFLLHNTHAECFV